MEGGGDGHSSSHGRILTFLLAFRLSFLALFCFGLGFYMIHIPPPSPRSSALFSPLSSTSPSRSYIDAGKKVHQKNYDYFFPSESPSNVAFLFVSSELEKIEEKLASPSHLVAFTPFPSTTTKAHEKAFGCFHLGRLVGDVVSDMRRLFDQFAVPPFAHVNVVIEGRFVECLPRFPLKAKMELFVVFNGTEEGTLSPPNHPHPSPSFHFITPSPSSSPSSNSLLSQAQKLYPAAKTYSLPAHQVIEEIFHLGESLAKKHKS